MHHLKMPQDSFELCNPQLCELLLKGFFGSFVTLINPLLLLFKRPSHWSIQTTLFTSVIRMPGKQCK